MALDLNATKLAQLIDPQVIAPLVEKKFFNYLKFSPLLTIDSTLAGRPGSTVDVPFYTYIGMAEDVAEGADISIKQLTQDYTQFTIKKAGIGVQLTDEALLSGFDDAMSQAVNQLGQSIAHKVNDDVVTALATVASPMIHYAGASGELSADVIADALALFGEDEAGPKVMFVSPKQLASLRKEADWIPVTELGVQALHSGALGMIWGVEIVVSNDVSSSAPVNYIVKPGALRLFLKRDLMVERDRDIINDSFILTANKHYGAYLYDASKALAIKYEASPVVPDDDDEPVTPVALNVSPESLSLEEGATGQLTVTPNQDVTFKSNDVAVATVSETGLVTALVEGNTTITVTGEDDSAEIPVVVTSAD